MHSNEANNAGEASRAAEDVAHRPSWRALATLGGSAAALFTATLLTYTLGVGAGQSGRVADVQRAGLLGLTPWELALCGGLALLAAVPVAAGLSRLDAHRGRAERQASRLRALHAENQLILDSTRDLAIYLLDADGAVASWNEGARALKGFEAHEVIGRHVSMFYPQSLVLAGEPWRVLEAACRSGVAKVEARRVRKDGSEFWAQVTITAVRGPSGRLEHFVKVVRDVTERHEAEERLKRHASDLAMLNTQAESQAIELGTRAAELEQARARAELADRTKSAFLANVSHEIRSPITAILGYAEVLADHGEDPAERTVAVDAIQRTGRHLLSVINDLLDLSKIEAGEMTIEQTACDIRAVLGDVRLMAREHAQRKQLRLEVISEGPLPERIHADPLRVRQVLLNLVSNAIKFTSRGEVRVVASCDRAAQRLTISVRDTGIGISAEAAERIFQPFVQSDDSTARRFGGTGLGLSISRTLARLMGGDIALRSVPGEGSTFTLTLATGPLDGVPDRRVDEPASIGPAAGGAERESISLAGLRILLVEDSPDLQRLLSAHLTRAGARVEVAANGHAGVNAGLRGPAGGGAWSVVLMDVQMPELDGLSATRQLRGAGFGTPIIALTANDVNKWPECREAGCNAFLAKPVTKSALLAACREYAQQHARRMAA